MKSELKYKIIAWILTMCLTVTLIPEIGHATETGKTSDSNQITAETLPQVSEEDVVAKTETTTTYDIGGGEKMEVIHGGEVRYRNKSGEWVDYDPSLIRIKPGERTAEDGSLAGYRYRNKTGDRLQYLPAALSEDTPVIMEREGYHIEITPTDETVRNAKLQNKTATAEEETIPSVYEGEETLPLNAVYGDEDDAVSLMYTSGENGIKETITLNERPQTNVFEYILDTGDLAVKENVTDEGLTIYDEETEEIIASVEAPWMNDASGNAYSQDITYTLSSDSNEEGRYRLIMTVDEEYLEDEERQYPVTIDPTTTWRGDDELRDVYVISGTYAGTNFYESGTKVMPVGVNSTGTHRTYIKPLNLKSEISGKSVSSAKMTVYETGNGASSQTIKAYRILENWSSASLTWNNRPTYASDPTAQITTTKTAKSAKTFDVTGFARKVAGSTSNYGLVLKNLTSSPSYAEFYGSRSTLTSYRPKLVVTYYDKPTALTSLSLARKSGENYTSTNYHRKGYTIYASWKGITSYDLSQVQYKIISADSSTPSPTSVGSSGVDLTTYRSIGLAAASATNKGVSYTSSLPAGKYRLYIRGKDAAGSYGPAKYKTFYVDGTAPTLTGVSVTPATSESQCTDQLRPTVSWNSTDTYFSKVTVSVDGGTAVSASVEAGAGNYTLPAGAITSSGTHTSR